MSRYFIELSYNGSTYHGWQIQPNAMSVQEVLEDAFQKALSQPIGIVGAGRTDTGVHATYFVAHFDIDAEMVDCQTVLNKVNRILPNHIVVYSLVLVDNETHSRFSATSRTYDYRLTTIKNPFSIEFSYRPRYLPDFDLMNQACQILFEYIDFTSFSKLHTDVKTNNCRIEKAMWERRGCEWVFTIKADRFLRNMVRAIVGTLLEVGRGKMSLIQFRQVIESKNRSLAGASAPAHALFLVDIQYPKELYEPVYKIQN